MSAPDAGWWPLKEDPIFNGGVVWRKWKAPFGLQVYEWIHRTTSYEMGVNRFAVFSTKDQTLKTAIKCETLLELRAYLLHLAYGVTEESKV